MWDIRSIMLFICSMVLVILISLSMANADEKKTITPNEFANAVAETPGKIVNFISNEVEKQKSIKRIVGLR